MEEERILSARERGTPKDKGIAQICASPRWARDCGCRLIGGSVLRWPPTHLARHGLGCPSRSAVLLSANW